MSASRQIRKLRLRAPAEQQARRGLLLMEDALRTASLHDEGGRIVILRQVRLGRFASDASSQSVALALERAVSELATACVHGGNSQAGDAPAVWFRDATEAYTLLALRLLQGGGTDAWYWPLAVPEWTRSSTLTESLQQLGYALAARDDAPAALPRWITTIVHAGHSLPLAQAFSPSDFRRLAEAAQLALPPMPPARENLPPGRPDATNELDRASSSEPSTAVLRALLRGANRIPGNTPPTQAPTRSESTNREPPPLPRNGAHHTPQPALPAAEKGLDSLLKVRSLPGRRNPSAPITQRQPPRPEGLAPGQPPGAPAMRRPALPDLPSILHRLPQSWPDVTEATVAGGLFFLVRVLEQCGYQAWLDTQPAWRDQHVAHHVLESVLARLRVDPDDAIYSSLRRPCDKRRPPRSFVAPRCWHSDPTSPGRLLHAASDACETLHDPRSRLLLAAWRGPVPRAIRDLMTDAQAKSATNPARFDTGYVANAWLTACRRWLRCHAHIGLADTVLRPAALAHGATHLDLWFELGQADPRIRRFGLDLDPGWVPWLRRVVGFHYGQPWPLAT